MIERGKYGFVKVLSGANEGEDAYYMDDVEDDHHGNARAHINLLEKQKLSVTMISNLSYCKNQEELQKKYEVVEDDEDHE